jgi:3-hydroxyisobutyrate dehydrogenase-like beta-hydroxyacid dehydrogenase
MRKRIGCYLPSHPENDRPMMNKRIGFFGLGIMGSRMAMNLLKAGNHISVYNRTIEKSRRLADAGANVSGSAGKLAAGSDIFFTMLADPASVAENALGNTGFLDHLNPGSVWVDFSTVNPDFTIQMKKESEKRNVKFMDAPVAGTMGPAESGDLIIFAGGREKDYPELVPLFEAVGKKTIWLDETGRGTKMKMVVNLILANAMAAFAEGMNLGRTLGLDYETMTKVLIGGPVMAPFLTAKSEKIRSSDYSAEFPLKHMLKDLFLATEEAYYHGAALPQTSATRELYSLSALKGLANLDFSAVYKFLEDS